VMYIVPPSNSFVSSVFRLSRLRGFATTSRTCGMSRIVLSMRELIRFAMLDVGSKTRMLSGAW